MLNCVFSLSSYLTETTLCLSCTNRHFLQHVQHKEPWQEEPGSLNRLLTQGCYIYIYIIIGGLLILALFSNAGSSAYFKLRRMMYVDDYEWWVGNDLLVVYLKALLKGWFEQENEDNQLDDQHRTEIRRG
jgi:hypothetical protein